MYRFQGKTTTNNVIFWTANYLDWNGAEAGETVTEVALVEAPEAAGEGGGTSNDITNLSGVSGTNVTQALDTLQSSIIAGGGGTVVGPDTSTDNAIPRFDGTDGYTLQDSGITIDDSDNIEGIDNITLTGSISVSGFVDGRDVSADGAT